MRKLFYMGLEPYKARYTLQLQEWNERVFKRRGINYVIVPGETLSNDQAIVTGQVLDAHGRTYFGMSQLMNLVKMMKAGECSNEDIVYFEDMMENAESEPVKLKAATEILDRAGVRGGSELLVDVEVNDARPAHVIVAERLQRLASGAAHVASQLVDTNNIIDAEIVENSTAEVKKLNGLPEKDGEA